MEMKSFDEIVVRAKGTTEKRTVAVVWATDDHSQDAVFRAADDGLLDFLFIGDPDRIKAVASGLGRDVSDAQICVAADPAAAALAGAQVIQSGRAHFLMKGKIETGEFLRPVVRRENGVSPENGVMSHIALNAIPRYRKLLLTTDGGMLPYPDKAQKIAILENAVRVMRGLGYAKPKVCLLAAVEKVNPKMPETVDAAEICELYRDADHCVVEGPISLDLALVRERSVQKGYESPCAGDADVLIVPNIHAGNILGKSLVELAGGHMAGLVMGAKCPIVLTSRGSSAAEKFNALALACAIC
ncbi:MAG: phosphate butyryltransferase [Clostridiales Family XIII bacterium]|jgi:phosphate butyryltransferase|nr:phosphate butyryltransferase [Clostridiales Family XIII bacterium]